MSDLLFISRRDGVEIIMVDHPPVNAINHAVRSALLNALKQISTDKDIAAVVITASGKTFMSGSDIREFDAPPVAPRLPDVIDVLESLSVPVVAAVHGSALGGGFEIAMGCHYRVALQDAKVGLPEINLGIIPGAGGTQRLPRLIGAEKALEWILSGRHISAAEAKAAGAIDEVVVDNLLEAAVAAAKRLAASGAFRRTGALTVPGTLGPDYFQAQRAGAAKKSRGFAAVPAAIDAVEAATAKPLAAGQQLEQQLSTGLKASDQSRAQRHLFFGEREVARIPDIAKDTKLRPLSTIGIVGAGTMGRGIAVTCLTAGYAVRWVDQTPEALARGVEAVTQIYQRDVDKKRITPATMAARLKQLTTALEIESLAAADLVIEAAFENMAVKQDVFRRLDRVCKPGAILATNTSTLDVNKIAGATNRASDVIGLHFFSPAHIMRLLEVVRGAASAKDAIATAMHFGKKIGKVAVLSGVCFGFIGNRMLEGYKREAQRLLLEGATPAQVDQALTDFGMAMGPCAVTDLAGVDVSFLTREGNRANLPNDPTYCAIGDALYRQGRYGQKTGKGFYRYVDGKAEEDPDVLALIKAEAERLGVTPRSPTAYEIVARCIYALINEGARILADGIALRPVDVDVVWACGYGFPRYRGGPMFHADLIGLTTVVDGLKRFAQDLGNDYGYWSPAPLLAKLADEGKTFKTWSAP